jgi:hypothetical protein
MSKYDVWVGAVADSAAFTDGAVVGIPHLFTPDTSCTVPYIYEMGSTGPGLQAFLPYAYTGDFADGGPSDDSRMAQGYIEIIEMGTMTDGDSVAEDELEELVGEHDKRVGSATAATHVLKEDDEGELYPEPLDCQLLVDNWTQYRGTVTKPHPLAGWWLDEAVGNCGETDIADVDPDDVGVGDCGQIDEVCFPVSGPDVCLDSTSSNSGGLFGGAAIINVAKGTMVSYDARALTGYDITDDGTHFYPGTIHPTLGDGDVTNAWVHGGGGMTTIVDYDNNVDAISAVFMHDEVANTFVVEEDIAAATEWVMTFPTKSWYVDPAYLGESVAYIPDEEDAGCNGWNPGEPFPFRDGPDIEDQEFWSEACETNPPGVGGCSTDYDPDWEQCTYVKDFEQNPEMAPFTDLFGADGACEPATLALWDREESPTLPGGEIVPPIVSPAPPGVAPPGEAPFELCYEVNLIRFGEDSVFGSELADDGGLVYSVSNIAPESGWGRVTLAGSDGLGNCVACGSKTAGYPEEHVDSRGLLGLPVTGFAAETYTNGFVMDGVLANYGGLFNHKGSVACDYDEPGDCGSGTP